MVQRHLAESSGTDEPLYQVHRLDRETSGTVLFARTLQAAQALGAQMVANTVQKVYYAVLVGVLTEEVDCRLPITRLHQVSAVATPGSLFVAAVLISLRRANSIVVPSRSMRACEVM